MRNDYKQRPPKEQYQQHPLKRQGESVASGKNKSKASQKQSEKSSLAQLLHAFNNQVSAEQENRSYKRYDPRNRYPSNHKRRGIADFLPTHREVKQSLDLLKDVLPKKNINEVVCQLYKNIVRRNENGEARKQLGIEELLANQNSRYGNQRTWYRNSSVLQLENNIKSLGKIDNSLNCSKTFPKDQNYTQKFRKPIQQQKYNKKYFIASVIYNKDYGVAALDEEITAINSDMKIDRMEYKTTAFSIATETYRKIEWFLSKECSKKIKPINREELRSIFRIILNCRVYFEADDVNTMLKFINAVYGLNAVTITGLEAMKLYRSIQEKLKIRITEKHIEPIIHREGPGHKAFKFKNYDNGNIFQLDKIWNQDFQNELLDLYKIDQSFSHIRDYFAKTHPENKQSFTMEAFRSKFGKIIRSALKKLTTMISKNSRILPSLTKLNDLRIKFIARSPEGLRLRFSLIDIYLQEGNQNLNKIRQLVETINEYIEQREKDTTLSKKYLIESQNSYQFKKNSSSKNNQSGNMPIRLVNDKRKDSRDAIYGGEHNNQKVTNSNEIIFDQFNSDDEFDIEPNDIDIDFSF